MKIEFVNYIYTPTGGIELLKFPVRKYRRTTGNHHRRVFCLIFNSLANPGRLRWTTWNALVIAVQWVIFSEEIGIA